MVVLLFFVVVFFCFVFFCLFVVVFSNPNLLYLEPTFGMVGAKD